jgi:hypothetical protein
MEKARVESEFAFLFSPKRVRIEFHHKEQLEKSSEHFYCA